MYLFQCEQCKGILSASVSDVTGPNNTVLTTAGLLKKLSGKKNGVIYIRVYAMGNNIDSDISVDREYTLQEINQIAMDKSPASQEEGKFY